MFNLIEDKNNSQLKTKEKEMCYKFLKDDDTIGNASINKDDENKVYIFIEKQYRGNGYGKKLFFEVLKELKNKNYNQIKVQFEKENIPMVKIAESMNGLQIGADTKFFQFEIPV